MNGPTHRTATLAQDETHGLRFEVQASRFKSIRVLDSSEWRNEYKPTPLSHEL